MKLLIILAATLVVALASPKSARFIPEGLSVDPEEACSEACDSLCTMRLQNVCPGCVCEAKEFQGCNIHACIDYCNANHYNSATCNGNTCECR